MEFDHILLSRLQFAFTVTFHVIFPAFTIGLAAFIATLLVRWYFTGRDVLHRLARFWTKIFAVSFGMGVVSGIVLSYQFGTNWSRFSVAVGNVIGPLIGYEVLTAFFLEASFLGVMLFGWRRVPPWLHVLSAIIVAFGTTLSAFWILAANSWMQTPHGHEVRDGVAYAVDWLGVIFNPSFPYRFAHMVTGCYLTTSLVVLAVGARYMIAGKYPDESRIMLHMAIPFIAILAPIQAVIGDFHGQNTLKYQPEKIAAIEANWGNAENKGPVALVLFAIPNEKTESNDFEIAIPHLGSIILTHSWDGYFKGLKNFPPSDRPPVLIPFYAFRLMVGLGVLMILAGWAGCYLWYRGRLETSRWYLKGISLMWPVGFTAVVAGWYVTEVGRQPWLAYNILRVADATSPVPTGSVATTLALFVLVYGVVFSMGIYYINRLIVRGPAGEAAEPPRQGTPSRPISSAAGAGREAFSKNG